MNNKFLSIKKEINFNKFENKGKEIYSKININSKKIKKIKL